MKLQVSSDTKKKPQILAIASNRVEEWFNESWKWLTRLRTAILIRVSHRKRLSTRTMRHDQRQAISKLLHVLLRYLDLKTMQIGFYHDESQTFVHLTLEFLAKKANLPLRRAQRALSWLYESGYVSGFRQSSFDIQTGEYTHKPSIRKVNEKLLFDLGITTYALQKARKRSSQQQQRKMLTRIIPNQLTSNTTNQNKDYLPKEVDHLIAQFTQQSPEERNKKIALRQSKLHKMTLLFPNLSQNEIESMLPASY